MDAGRHAMRVRISTSWTAGRTCSEPAPIVLIRVRAPSPSLLGLFAVRRLVSRWLQGNAPPPRLALGTPNSDSGGTGEELQVPACIALALPGPRKGAQHGRARDLAGSQRLQKGRGKAQWALGQEPAPGSRFWS